MKIDRREVLNIMSVLLDELHTMRRHHKGDVKAAIEHADIALRAIKDLVVEFTPEELSEIRRRESHENS